MIAFHRVLSFDLWILLSTILLWLSGVISVYTTSFKLGVIKHGDALYYLKNHLLFSSLGFLIFFYLSVVNIKIFKDNRDKKIPISYLLLAITFVLLMLVFIPGLSHKAGNARRWINLVFLKFQPSEFLKFALCVFYANYFVRYSRDLHTAKYGLLLPFAVLCPFLVLLLIQPDLGTLVMLCCWLCSMLFVAGVNLTYPVILGITGTGLAGLFVYLKGYNIDRILVFLDPWKDPLGKGFQPIHSMYAFALGGFSGRGAGESLQKLFYLPEAHTDYALSVIAEEFGFMAVLCISLFYAIIILRGIKVANSFSDNFRRYLSWAVTSLFGMQVVVNIGVVTALFPPKGLTLPFISYGGSSLVLSFALMGILMNLSMEREEARALNTATSLIGIKR